MVKGDPKNLNEEFKRHLTGTKNPSKKRFLYKILVIILILIFGTILTILIKDPLSKWASNKFFTKESNLTILIVDRDGKEFVEKFGDDKFYIVLNPTLKGSDYRISLWLTANGDTTIYTERIYFTIFPCYWYKPIEKQQYTIEPDQTIEIPLDFTFDKECTLVDELANGKILDFMVRFGVEVDYRTNDKLKEQKKYKNFPINTKILLKNFTNQE